MLSPPMRAFYLATKPFVDAFNGLGNLMLKPFGSRPPLRLATRRTARMSCANYSARAARAGSSSATSSSCRRRLCCSVTVARARS
jgi:CBS domain containing-hemolysin-like protein